MSQSAGIESSNVALIAKQSVSMRLALLYYTLTSVGRSLYAIRVHSLCIHSYGLHILERIEECSVWYLLKNL
jgi:hypothetical protein